ncbi:hypothetical protein ACM26V_04395 [Salipaludibacillus sp. HK11]|uniref:hypothetical protein n=1 Tax=Salipaludibacillus sp. HK11 TaxID=3394320 RepID=UPI0039FBC977
MKNKDKFTKWLEEQTDLAQSSILKYTGAINTISKELIESNIISLNLYHINSANEVELIRERYFSISEFIEKDKRGNRMYSRALSYYIEFTRIQEKY